MPASLGLGSVGGLARLGGLALVVEGGVFGVDYVAEFVLEFVEDEAEFVVAEGFGEGVAEFSATLEGDVAEGGRL